MNAMVRKTLILAGAWLVAFHVWLFAGQVWQGQLVDLGLVSRWVIAAGLVGALYTLHKRGLSIVRSRQAVAVWLLAGLLHGPALARDLEITTPAIPEVVATLSQVATGLTLLSGILLIGLAGLRRRASAPLLASVPAGAHVLAGLLHQGADPRFSPRPPPKY